MTSINTETPTNDAPEAQAIVNSTCLDQDESTTISKEPESKSADTGNTKTADSDSETDDAEGHPDTKKTKLEMGHFIKRFRIFDSEAWSWIPYDPSKEELYRPVERDDVDNYFYVDVRYHKAGGAVCDQHMGYTRLTIL